MAVRKKAKAKPKKAPARKPVARKKATTARKTAAKKKAPARRPAPKKKPAPRRAAPKKAPAPRPSAPAPKPSAPAPKPSAPAPKPSAPAPKPSTPAPRVKVLGPLPPVSTLPKSPAPAAAPPEERVGVVTHYFTHLGVASVWMESGSLKVGDTVHITGHTSDFRQRIESMQVEHQDVEEVATGQEFGLKVVEHAREHDVVYKVIEPAA